MGRINRLQRLLSTGSHRFPTGGLRNPAFGPSLVGIGDKAGSPSDGPSVQALRTLDVSRIAHGRERAEFFYPRRSVLTAFLAACFLADATLFASAQTGAAMIAIDRMTPGSPPAGFSFARTGQGSGGEWTVTADPTAAAGQGDRADQHRPHRLPVSARDPREPVGRQCRRRSQLQGGSGQDGSGRRHRRAAGRMPTITMWPAPMRWRITCASIASSPAGASNWMAPI